MVSNGYLAGFLDGEGSITIIRHKDNRVKRGYVFSPQLSFTNSNIDAIEAISDSVGGKIKLKTKTEGRKQVYVLMITGIPEIKALIKRLRPYLIVKKRQADLMLVFCNSRLKHLDFGYTDEEIKMAEMFRALNQRGELSPAYPGERL